MPNRIIREAILSSEAIAGLSWAEEVFYRRLMSIVDDYGRFEANPQLIRAKCYPLQTDDVKAAEVSAWLESCRRAGILKLYTANGKNYLEVSKFQQQTRTASKCPAPDSECSQMISNAHLVVSVSVVGVEGVSEKKADAPQKRGARLPADWKPTETDIAYAVGKGVNWQTEAENFADFWHAKAGKDACKADWSLTWKMWVRRAPVSTASVVPIKSAKQALAPSESRLERDIAWVRRQYELGQIDQAERDDKIQAATDKHRGLQ